MGSHARPEGWRGVEVRKVITWLAEENLGHRRERRRKKNKDEDIDNQTKFWVIVVFKAYDNIVCIQVCYPYMYVLSFFLIFNYALK